MPRKILIRTVKENQARIKVIANHQCKCQGSIHKSLTALITKQDKTFTVKVCERDKGACVMKRANRKIKYDGKHSMQYSQVFTLKNEIALVYL